MSVHIFGTMGTVAGLRMAGELPSRRTLDALESEFSARDDRFSLYRPDSEISRIARGEVHLTASSDEFRAAYARSLRWRSRTFDAFTPHRPDGVIDLSGTVKAEAIEAAGDVLVEAGCTDWMLNVGGDLHARGLNGHDPWRVGIVDPEDRSDILCTLEVEGPFGALATSGTAERGEHVWRSDRLGAYRQVTVRASDIVTADVLATAILAGGERTRDEMLSLFGDQIDVLTVDVDSALTATPRIAAAASFVFA